MSRSKRKVKPETVFPIFETGCPLCDPEARRQQGLDKKRKSDNNYVKKQIQEGTDD